MTSDDSVTNDLTRQDLPVRLPVLRDVLSRVVVAREELEVGAADQAAAVLWDLEEDLAATVAGITDHDLARAA